MEPCLDPASIGFDVSLRDYLDAAAFAGFRLVEVPIPWVRREAQAQGRTRVVQTFRRRRLTPIQFTCGLGVPGNLAVASGMFEDRLRSLSRLADLAVSIGCLRASLFVDESRNGGMPLPTSALADRARRVVDVLGQVGISLSLGLLGRPRLEGVEDLWGQIDRPDLDLLVDTVSMAKADLGEDWIDGLQPGRIGWFRVADVPFGSPGTELTYADRLLPGTGRLPLAEWYAAGIRNGYRGPVSVEVGDPGMNKHSPRERARLSFRHTVLALGGGPAASVARRQ